MYFHGRESYLIQRLRDIGDEILGRLQTAAHAHQLGGHTGGSQLLIVHLTVGTCLLYTSDAADE